MDYPPLEAAEAKIRRAHEDLQTLHADAQRFLDRQPYFIAVEFERESGWHVARAQLREEPPPGLSVRVGGIAYQILSALNLVTWSVAVRKLGARRAEAMRNAIQFPVTFSPRHFANTRLVREALVSRQALAVFERLQPYNGHHGLAAAREHPLAIIKELADADKHRVLAAAYGRMGFAGVRLQWDRGPTGPQIRRVARSNRMLKRGAQLARIRFKTGNEQANVRVDPQPALEILFETDNWAITVHHVGNGFGAALTCLDAFRTLFP